MLVILGDTFHFTHIYISLEKLCYICTEGALIFSDMKKEKQIKSYTRRTKSVKTVNPSTKGVGNLARIKSPTFVRCCLAVDVLPIRRRL